VGIVSMAVIVSAFMGGLGLGSHLGGVLSARLDARGALRAFALLELGIAGFAAASGALYHDVLVVRAAPAYASLAVGAALHLAALLPPTLLMGMSLPLLVRALVRDAPTAGGTIGFLYGMNVVGAGLGALLAPWVLIRHLGLEGALWCGALANACVGAGALALGPRLGRDAPAPPGRDAADAAAPAERGAPFATWTALYALSGFAALSLEILWLRVMDVAVKSTSFTFGTVLAVYLLGYAAGSLAGAARARRVRRPLRAFLLLQALIPLVAALPLIALAALPPDVPGLAWFVDYWSRPQGLRLGRVWDWPAILRLYVLLPGVLFALPTVLMGLSFPVLQRAVQDDPATSGRKVGLLQAANIAGCMAGSLAVGLVTLTLLGTPGTLRLLLGVGGAFALLGARREGWRSPFGVLVAGSLAAATLLPGEAALWLRLHGRSTGPAHVDEDATSVVALTAEGQGWRLFVNGASHSTLPYGGVHTWLGALPALVHPDPREVAIVGLGSGDTAWAAACRRETEREVVWEICAPQPRLLRALGASEHPPAKLRQFLRNERVRIVIADGRHALRLRPDRFDLIELDALKPDHAFSGNLYSLEFFEIARTRLKPGGLMCSWSPTPRTRATFARAFPQVLECAGGQILIGSVDPIPGDPGVWSARLRAPAVWSYFGTEVAEDVLERLRSCRLGGALAAPDSDLNRDLYPRDEFAAPRSGG
jgi:predicted membrane-bound spermidine synthase